MPTLPCVPDYLFEDEYVVNSLEERTRVSPRSQGQGCLALIIKDGFLLLSSSPGSQLVKRDPGNQSSGTGIGI